MNRTIDEVVDRLGRSLRLPEPYESRRAEIEAQPPPLVIDPLGLSNGFTNRAGRRFQGW